MIIDYKHIGNGIYLSYDGSHIVLNLRVQNETTKTFVTTSTICLNDEAFQRLLKFRVDLVKEMSDLDKDKAHQQASSRPQRPDSLSGPRQA